MANKINQKVKRARKLVKDYARSVGEQNENIEIVMADVLADLMHLADAEHEDFQFLLERARGYYRADEEYSEE
jgi:uncharacterized membrane protein